MLLTGLEGRKEKFTECMYFESEEQITNILFENNKAATTADYNGAINIWLDDEGYIRCESMRYLSSLEKKKYSRVSDVKKWAKKWLEKIK